MTEAGKSEEFAFHSEKEIIRTRSGEEEGVRDGDGSVGGAAANFNSWFAGFQSWRAVRTRESVHVVDVHATDPIITQELPGLTVTLIALVSEVGPACRDVI